MSGLIKKSAYVKYEWSPRSKVIKFEESMAQEIQKDILKEEPLDWVKSKVHRGLYSKPFAWKKSAPCTSTYNDIQVQLELN